MTVLCERCGQMHSGPCTVGNVEALRMKRKREKIADMRARLQQARTLNDARELGAVVSDLIDMIERKL